VDQHTIPGDDSSAHTPFEASIQARRTLEAETAALVAAAAHDLRTPLCAIQGFTQLLRRGLDRDTELDRAQVVQRLEHIEGMLTQMNDLISHLLAAARSEMGNAFALQRQPVDLAALAREVVTEYLQPGGSHRISIDAPQTVTGRWDRTQLGRVVINLVGNAMKYSPAGSEVVLAVRRVDEARDRWAILSVTDSGSGIPKRDLPHVCDEFYRGGKVNQGVAGTGLGLAIVRRIVDQYGGALAISSEEASGTTITIRLPIDDETALHAR
jgi:signal transduction histidine kinase